MNAYSETGQTGQRERALAGVLREKVGAGLAAWAADQDLPVAEREAWARDMIADGLAEYSRNAIATGADVLPRPAEARITETVINVLFGLGGLQPLLDDQDIENIYVNGCDTVFVDTVSVKGKQVAPIAGSDEELIDMIRMAAARTGSEERRFDRLSPELNLELSDGSRMHAIGWITARPSITIRRHRFASGVTLSHLVELGTMTTEVAEQLAACVRAKKNIVIAGSTNAGKTTNLRALAAEIPSHERLITIEDTFEMGLHKDPRHPNVVPLQAREGNLEGVGTVTQAQCVRAGLRMSPDRVIVGEVRGDEILPMLAAMSQGNDGSMTTVHANSTAGVFTRFATYAAQAPERLSLEAAHMMIAGAVDVIIHVAKIGGKRVLTGIREVTGYDGTQVTSNEVYRPGPDGRAVYAFGWRAETVQDLVDAGADQALFTGRWSS